MSSKRLRINYLKKIIPLLVLFMLLGQYIQAQQIKGKVTSDTGEALPGVSIKIEGTSTGTVTDLDGNFTITVPSKESVLVFSYIGFVSERVVAGEQSQINLTMAGDLKTLDEVVVIGYGSVKKRDLTGPVSNVSSKQIEERQPVTLFDALEGQAAGVLISNDNGDPFGQGTVQIRGASTINSGSGPLYVIDGVLSDNASLVNPTDIESVDILKDAASASIYGARGANGVIIITTKRGKEGKPSFAVNFSHTWGQLAHKLRTTSADEFRYYKKMRSGSNPPTDSINPYWNNDNDYQDALLRTANKSVVSISASGGQKGFLYYAGLTYTDDNSIVINSYLHRLQTKLSAQYTYGNLHLSNDISFEYETGNVIPVYNSLRMVWEKNPYSSIYRPDGTFASTVDSKRNPIAQAYLNINKQTNYTVLNNTQGSYQITKDLKFTTIFSAKLNIPTIINLAPAATSTASTQIANGYNSFGTKFDWSYQAFLNYSKTIASNHTITALAAFSADRSRTDDYQVSMSNYLSENILTSSASTVSINPNDTYTDATANSTASFFGRLGYSYKGKYILQGSYRRDGSSRFGIHNKWGNFWAGSAAWRFSDESFMEWARNILTDGKLRYSFGQAGNDNIGDYVNDTYITFTPENKKIMSSYAGQAGAALSSTMGNSLIKWENTSSHNFGTDLSFLKGRLTFTVDYYIKTTDNLLYKKELPKETGFSNVTVNLGTIENKGLEFTLTGRPVETKDFKWDLLGNISFERPKIKELAGHIPFINGNKYIQEGGRIGDFYLLSNLGVYPWNQSNAYNADGKKLGIVFGSDGTPAPIIDANGIVTGYQYTLSGQPYDGIVYQKSRTGYTLVGGDTEWKDLNNDGVIDDNDRSVVGHALPDYYFGLGTTLTYKNFSLNVMFNGQMGKSIYNQTAANQNSNGSSNSPPMWDAILTSWQKPGDITKYPYFPTADKHGSMTTGYNSLYLEDGSFIRLASARLSYSLNKALVNKIKMQGVSVFVYGVNLATWTNYKGWDPEFGLSGLDPGNDNGKYPKRREVGFGANFNF